MHKGLLETGDAPPVQQVTPVNESGVAASQGRESHKGNGNTSFSREILSDGRRSGPAKNLAFFFSVKRNFLSVNTLRVFFPLFFRFM